MQILYRFIQALPNAITPVYNQLLAIGDKPFDIFAKIQGLLSVRQLRTVNTANIVGGSSTTNDISISQLVIPGGRLIQGSVFLCLSDGQVSKATGVSNGFVLWVKINGVKILSIPYKRSNTLNNLPLLIRSNIVVKNVGTNGVINVDGFSIVSRGTANDDTLQGVGGEAAVNTTLPVTITLGFNYNGSNASNTIVANTGIIAEV